MHAHPLRSGFGPESVRSVAALVDAIKRRQMLKPAARLALAVGRDLMVVAYSGVLEVDADAITLAAERELDARLARLGGELDDVRIQ
jgi:hypothetical protein